jgi:hypothetical protein
MCTLCEAVHRHWRNMIIVMSLLDTLIFWRPFFNTITIHVRHAHATIGQYWDDPCVTVVSVTAMGHPAGHAQVGVHELF